MDRDPAAAAVTRAEFDKLEAKCGHLSPEEQEQLLDAFRFQWNQQVILDSCIHSLTKILEKAGFYD